jgi:aconitate hydratase
MPLADRATISNMSPEFGCTATLFPVDEETLRYMRFSGRQEDHVQRVRDYMEAQGTFHSAEAPEAEYTKLLELDLGSVVPSVAGPKRPQDRWNLERVRDAFFEFFPDSKPGSENEGEGGGTVVATEKKTNELTHASVVIAAITSCTNTSNPTLMLASGLVAKKCHELGINPKPWVKTSFAPGSRVVTRYMEQSGLMDELESVGFHLVGYGCTTCIGNSGPLPEEVAKEVTDKDLTVASVLSGNRNFEGRVNPLTKANFLMSPPLVVAYAMAGTVDIDLVNDPIAKDKDGNDVYLKDIWPSQKEVAEVLENNVTEDMYAKTYDEVFEGDDEWNEIEVSQSDLYPWNDDSTYIKKAPYFEGMPPEVPETVPDLQDLSVLALLGDSVTTDHISPAGAIKPDSPAGRYLIEQGVRPHEFNSFGARRGNHEVMIRGTFGNIRLRNLLAPGTEGGFTKYLPTGEVMDLYDAAMKYKAEGKGLIVLAGKEYGTGSSRDWAAKGTLLLGVKAVLAQSFERIHRSNLIGMGVLPLQFEEGEGVEELNLDAESPFTVEGIQEAYDRNKVIAQKFTVKAKT